MDKQIIDYEILCYDSYYVYKEKLIVVIFVDIITYIFCGVSFAICLI